MKSIDVKSLLIGALLTSTIFLGVAATGTTDKWDDKQEWYVANTSELVSMGFREDVKLLGLDCKTVSVYGISGGWEPVGKDNYRKRIK